MERIYVQPWALMYSNYYTAPMPCVCVAICVFTCGVVCSVHLYMEPVSLTRPVVVDCFPTAGSCTWDKHLIAQSMSLSRTWSLKPCSPLKTESVVNSTASSPNGGVRNTLCSQNLCLHFAGTYV